MVCSIIYVSYYTTIIECVSSCSFPPNMAFYHACHTLIMVFVIAHMIVTIYILESHFMIHTVSSCSAFVIDDAPPVLTDFLQQEFPPPNKYQYPMTPWSPHTTCLIITSSCIIMVPCYSMSLPLYHLTHTHVGIHIQCSSSACILGSIPISMMAFWKSAYHDVSMSIYCILCPTLSASLSLSLCHCTYTVH